MATVADSERAQGPREGSCPTPHGGRVGARRAKLASPMAEYLRDGFPRASKLVCLLAEGCTPGLRWLQVASGGGNVLPVQTLVTRSQAPRIQGDLTSSPLTASAAALRRVTGSHPQVQGPGLGLTVPSLPLSHVRLAGWPEPLTLSPPVFRGPGERWSGLSAKGQQNSARKTRAVVFLAGMSYSGTQSARVGKMHFLVRFPGLPGAAAQDDSGAHTPRAASPPPGLVSVAVARGCSLQWGGGVPWWLLLAGFGWYRLPPSSLRQARRQARTPENQQL